MTYDEQMALGKLTPDKIEKWNTGCLYTAKGQRIAAAVFGKVVVFVDVDRSIGGKITAEYNPDFNLRYFVAHHYGRYNYESMSPYSLWSKLADAATTNNDL